MKDNYFYNNGKLERFIKINAISYIETIISITAKLNLDYESNTQGMIASKVLIFEFWNDAFDAEPASVIIICNN
jgi:hypothetical protein